MAANVRMNNVLTGSLKDFSGTLSTNETSANNNRQSWNFGSGGACATGEGNAVLETAPFWEAIRVPQIPGWPHNITSITTIRNWC